MKIAQDSASTKTHSFRRDRQRSTLVSWLVLLVLVGWWTNFSLVPEVTNWVMQVRTLQTSEGFLQNLEKVVQQTEGQVASINDEFESLAREPLAQETRLFPPHLEVGTIAKTLEFYAIMAEALDTTRYTSRFELHSLNFGETQMVQNAIYKETPMTLNLLVDERNLRTFVKYLQSGVLPERLKRVQPTYKDAHQFLTEHALPLIHIDSIRLGDPSVDEKTESSFYSVQIMARLFSQ